MYASLVRTVRRIPVSPARGRLRILPSLLALVALGLAACSDDQGGGLGVNDREGTEVLSARLISPAGPEAAVILEASQDRVRGIEAADRITRIVGRTENGRLQVALIRQFPGELRFRVVATRDEEPPVIDVLQVADGENRIRESLEGYRVEVSR